MERGRKLQGLRESLGQELIRKGDEYVFLCPRCKHHKPKLSVNLDTDWFHCWVCGFKGQNLAPLLRGQIKAEYVTELKGTGADKRQERKYDEVRLPPEFRTLTRVWRSPYYEAAVNYLMQRKLYHTEFAKWKLGYCEEGEYKHRIIVPSFDEYGHLNFFVGRYFYDTPGIPKYKSGNFCKDIIWNDYMIDWEQPVTITEGPFDAFRASENVIPLQGTILHDRLLTKIVTSGVEVFMALDSDAREKQQEIVGELISYGVVCRVLSLGEKKDLGEMTHEEIEAAKSTALPIYCSADYLRSRLN